MSTETLSILEFLLDSRKAIKRETIPTLEAWKIRYSAAEARWEDTTDRAAAGGYFSDRIAYAFAAGYQCAIKRLIPSTPAGVFASLCITEQGGGHPSAIATSLQKTGAAFSVTGSKQFITMADVADIFYIAASTGHDDRGKNSITMVRLEKKNPAVTIEPMPELKFVPEVGHCRLVITDARIRESDILPGDGFAEYIRPFRTAEDLHIFAALAGYLFRCATLYSWGGGICEQLTSLLAATRALSRADLSAPHLHIALAGLIAQFENVLEIVDPLWETADEESRQRWIRDKALFRVAGSVREKRLRKAWEKYPLSS